MSKILLAMLVAMASMGAAGGLSAAELSSVIVERLSDTVVGAPGQVSTVQEPSAGGMFFMAGQATWRCMEQCAQVRFQCERENKGRNPPGTKENWDESRGCQARYRDCLDRCQ
jgi:hypothetical protein